MLLFQRRGARRIPTKGPFRREFHGKGTPTVGNDPATSDVQGAAAVPAAAATAATAAASARAKQSEYLLGVFTRKSPSERVFCDQKNVHLHNGTANECRR